MDSNFISSGRNIVLGSGHDWHHFANLDRETIRGRWLTPTGKGILQSLKAAGFTKQAIDSQVGKFADKYDLRGIPLAGERLTKLNLTNIDFFHADLSGADFSSCDLRGSYLSECDISSTTFNWAKLEGVLLDNVRFNSNTSFLGINLHDVNFTFATLLYDLALSQQRIQQLEQHYKHFAWLLKYTCDYGRSFRRYFGWVVSIVFLYALVYFGIDQNPGNRTFFDYMYFSTLTFATVDYCDIVMTTTLGRIAVLSEIILGYLMGGLLVAILAKRVMG